MLEFSQIIIRLVVAMGLGAAMGVERELAGKEAGVRTEMLVSGGSALFTLAALMIPFVVSPNLVDPSAIIINNSGIFHLIANIVVGIGFLGAGMIIKTTGNIHGLTTAALVWTTGAIGIMAGLGLFEVALTSTIFISGMLYLLRRLDISGEIETIHQQKT